LRNTDLSHQNCPKDYRSNPKLFRNSSTV